MIFRPALLPIGLAALGLLTVPILLAAADPGTSAEPAPKAAAAPDAKSSPAATSATDEKSVPVSPVGFVKGYTWGWTGGRGTWLGDAPAESMKRLAETGSQWACIGFVGHMTTRSTPEVRFADADPTMATDDEIRHAIRLARDNHLKVILKPVVEPADGQWRGTIEFKTADGKTDEAAWAKWWKTHEAFMVHYATIAQAEKCELLCIGCEMSTTERFEKAWRAAIAKVRQVYSGPLIYDTNWGDEEKVAWWDAVDIIGISAYYPVSTRDDTSLDRMVASWQKIRDRLRQLAAARHRPILFIEIGVRSAHTATTMPWDFSHPEWPVDVDEQARYYEAVMKTFYDEPWFCGFAWWDWPAHLYAKDKAAADKGFCCFGKPAEAVLRTWYAKPWDRPGTEKGR
jgi:hypothetical protein